MKIIIPPSLKPGGTIGVMAPSSRIAPEDIETSRTYLEEKGFKVFIHPQCYNTRPPLSDGRYTQYAGTVAEKVLALHDLIKDLTISAVFFASGGQRAITLLDHLDYSLFTAHPKILMGFSDNTLLLNAISACTGLITYHGPTFKRLPYNPQADFNLRLLQGQEKEITLSGSTILKDGTAQGILRGGNFTLVCTMEEDELPPDDTILFLEDINEELTTIDRNLCVLRRRGVLSRIKGLILGQFTDILDTGTPFGMSFQEIIAEHTEGLDIPILLNAPFGHADNLYIMPIGVKANLNTSALNLQLLTDELIFRF